MTKREPSKWDGTALPLPAQNASESELVAHFAAVNDLMACIPYDDAIYRCSTCFRIGENVKGKGSGPSGRARFCSDLCMTLWERRWALYKARRGTIPAKLDTPPENQQQVG